MKNMKVDEEQRPEILKSIEKKLFNATYAREDLDLRSFFGLRVYPFDYEGFATQKLEIKRLKTSLKKKKDENSRLIKKIETLIAEKRKIQEELAELKASVANSQIEDCCGNSTDDEKE